MLANENCFRGAEYNNRQCDDDGLAEMESFRLLLFIRSNHRWDDIDAVCVFKQERLGGM